MIFYHITTQNRIKFAHFSQNIIMKVFEFKSKNYCNQNNTKNNSNNIILLIVLGLLIGFINGFFGGGGGMICVPILSYILGLPDKNAHATTILIMLPLSIASFVIYLIKGSIVLNYAIAISIGFVIGGILGAFLLNKINNVVLQFVFAFVIILGGIKLIF